jgi:hypothetical protein
VQLAASLPNCDEYGATAKSNQASIGHASAWIKRKIITVGKSQHDCALLASFAFSTGFCRCA